MKNDILFIGALIGTIISYLANIYVLYFLYTIVDTMTGNLPDMFEIISVDDVNEDDDVSCGESYIR